MPKYLISWDNGVDACGTFPWVYDDYDKAVQEAEFIFEEMMAENGWSEEGGCEVIEMPEPKTNPNDEGDFHEDVVMEWKQNPLPHQIEGTVDHFDRYIG